MVRRAIDAYQVFHRLRRDSFRFAQRLAKTMHGMRKRRGERGPKTKNRPVAGGLTERENE